MKAIGRKISKIFDAIENIDHKWELIVITVLSCILVFGIVIGMGTLTCGYHLVDDHQLLRWTYEMKYGGESVFDIIKKELMIDFSIRYRPAYLITHILETKLFGINLTWYSLVKAIEVVLSCIFLYYCGRLMGAKKVYAFLFSAISLTGYQSATWWKLGTHEIQGTLLFAMGFYCMLKWLAEKKKRWAIGSIIIYILMCNYKESFVILAPFIMLYVVYDEMKKRESEEKQKLSINYVWDCIKANFYYLIALFVVFIIPVIIITFFVGTNNYDGVGLDASLPIVTYYLAIKDAFQYDLKWFMRFGILFGLILLTYWENLKKLWREILLTICFIFPQFIIYGESGINERYIIPTSIGYAFFFIVIIPKWKSLSGKRRGVYVLGILLLLAANGRAALREADYFRYRGESITTMLETVQSMSDNNTKILSCFRPNEEGNLTINYWMLNHGFDNVYYWTEDTQIINQVCDINLNYSEDKYTEQSFEDMDIVVMYNKEDRHWCYTPSLDLTGFTEQKCGTLTIYVRDSSGIVPVDTTVEGLRINF